MLDILSLIFTYSYKVLSVVTPMLNYLPQYFLMHKQQSAGTFAIQLCYLLMSSSMLRILFWYHERFEVCLLLQSIVVFGLQLLLLHKYLEVTQRTIQVAEKPDVNLPIHSNAQPSVTPMLIRTITPLITSYVVFIAVYLWTSNYYVIQATGSIACFLEVILPVPQVMKNWQCRSVKGLRLDY
jgi:hypothetical protein